MVNEMECEKAGVDPQEVEKIIKGFSRYLKRAKALELTVFGGSCLSLRYRDDLSMELGDLVLAITPERNVDGGCGAYIEDENGLLRGES